MAKNETDIEKKDGDKRHLITGKRKLSDMVEFCTHEQVRSCMESHVGECVLQAFATQKFPVTIFKLNV